MQPKYWSLGWFGKWLMLALAGFFLQSNSFGQQGDIQADSVKKLLCKTWEIDYALTGGVKIGRSEGVPDLVYEFRPDTSYVVNPDDPKRRTAGKWAYDAQNKWIRLSVNGKIKASIFTLFPAELVMRVNLKKVSQTDPGYMQMVFSVKKD